MKIGTSNIHNAIKFTLSVAYDSYVDIFMNDFFCIRAASFLSAKTFFWLILEVEDGTPTHRKSWAGNLLVWSDLTLGPLLITRLLLVQKVLDGKPTYMKS